MSNIKKFFSKLKSEVKFGKAGEGHRLNDPPPRNVQTQQRPPTTTRQPSDGGAAARAAADAAQQRFQHQTSLQNSAAASKDFVIKYEVFLLFDFVNSLKIV